MPGKKQEITMRVHKNATTSPQTRQKIQSSKASVAELAVLFRVSPNTIRKWKSRDHVEDRSHRPLAPRYGLNCLQDFLVCYLKRLTQWPLERLVEVSRQCIAKDASRSAVYRALRRNDISSQPTAGASIPNSLGALAAEVRVDFRSLRDICDCWPNFMLAVAHEFDSGQFALKIIRDVEVRPRLDFMMAFKHKRADQPLFFSNLHGQGWVADRESLSQAIDAGVFSPPLTITRDPSEFQMVQRHFEASGAGGVLDYLAGSAEFACQNLEELVASAQAALNGQSELLQPA